MTRNTTFIASGQPAVRASASPRSLWRPRRWHGPVLALLIWSFVGTTHLVPATVLPAPWTVASALIGVLRDGTLPVAVGVSAGRLITGFFLGSIAGLALGLLAGLWRHGKELFDGSLQALRAIPFLALAPLFNLWFSNAEIAKVMLVSFGSLFPLYLSTTAGIRTVDIRLLEAAKVSGMTPAGHIVDVILPGALPRILTGLRIGFTWALAALVSAELTSSATGIGAVVAEAREYVQTDLLFVCAITYALLELVADGLLRVASRHLLRWRQPYQGT